jgi:U3 small nucleolar RNA-associated protein 25
MPKRKGVKSGKGGNGKKPKRKKNSVKANIAHSTFSQFAKTTPAIIESDTSDEEEVELSAYDQLVAAITPSQALPAKCRSVQTTTPSIRQDAADHSGISRVTPKRSKQASASNSADAYNPDESAADAFHAAFFTEMPQAAYTKRVDEMRAKTLSNKQTKEDLRYEATYAVVKGSRLLSSYQIRESLQSKWSPGQPACEFTREESSAYVHMNSYCDFFHAACFGEQMRSVERVAMLHALNHVTRGQQITTRNTERIKQAKASGQPAPDLRDGSLTRARVLILAPMRNTAFRCLEKLLALHSNLDHPAFKGRFTDEFGPLEDTGEPDPAVKQKPADFRETFDGNTDDSFVFGLKLARKSVKLYAAVQDSDIIIASPLAVRLLVGEDGKGCDCLSSIEVVIVLQLDVLLMQNWEHMLTAMSAINQLPTKDHGTDFSRTRNFCLNGWSKHFRQTILMAPHLTPELNALFRDHCCSIRGKARVSAVQNAGVVHRVVPQVRQVFQRIDDVTPADADETRLSYFTDQLMPKLRKSAAGEGHTIIYIPAYFDYVRLRNWFRKQCREIDRMNFTTLCEYTDAGDVTRNRSTFFHGKAEYCLYTERFHFYNRCLPFCNRCLLASSKNLLNID